MELKLKYDNDVHKYLELIASSPFIATEVKDVLIQFTTSYLAEMQRVNMPMHSVLPVIIEYIDHVYRAAKCASSFSPLHYKNEAMYQLGINLISPLVSHHSSITNSQSVTKIEEKLRKNENIILLANHQTEADPQIISILLNKSYSFAQNIFYVAGERVIVDPMAAPLAAGCNIIPIFSKKYMNSSINKKSEKTQHNLCAIKEIQQLLNKGGSCIYVAPSGGRDRKSPGGQIIPSVFDEKSVRLFELIAGKSKRPTSFVPLAMHTYEILPPPCDPHLTRSEKRIVQKNKAHLHFMDHIPSTKEHASYKKLSIIAYQQVAKAYAELLKK